MEYDHLIIDGYNLLHQDDAMEGHRDDLQTARQRLVRKVEPVALDMASRVTIVFDGRESGADASLSGAHLEVVFSPSNRTADAVIERMASDSKNPERICVVTSDRVEEQIVSAAGAMVLSCQEFVRRCDATNGAAVSQRGSMRGKSGSTLADFFPKSAE
jgi:predicted RNA-binding protein with PIN domain